MAGALGIDVGGTFTDFVAIDGEGQVRTWKRLSTPANPEQAIIDGAGDAAGARVVHGSTVATNALLERRGPRVVLVTTAGFRDLLTIRRQVRPELYALEPMRRPHVVARGDAVGAEERMGADGEAVLPLSPDAVARVVQGVQETGAESIAVCLLHAYLYPGHERMLAAALQEAGLDVSVSSELVPEPREYERASTTAINAFLRPTIRSYLQHVDATFPGIRIIQSDATLATAAQASETPVSMLLSGPSGGVLGALRVAQAAGYDNIITFDMGGTSTDVALCPGKPPLRTATELDGLALIASSIDIETVGAGGGSIARIDEGGALVVGPESAGADPGPACYGKGTMPTVTDANLVLGRLRPEQRLGETVAPDLGRAMEALATLGEPAEAGAAVIDVVNANMARSLSRVSLERGFSASDFTLVAFGGAGPLHACALAEELGFPRVLIPATPGVLSAQGMLTAAEGVAASRGLVLELGADGSTSSIADAAAAIENEATGALKGMGVEPALTRWAADVRYLGQAHELRCEIANPDPAAIATAFHAAHEQRFGYQRPDAPVELVTLRGRVESPAPELTLPRIAQGRGVAHKAEGDDIHVVARNELQGGDTVIGPASVVQNDATTYVAPGWRGTTDEFGNLVLERT